MANPLEIGSESPPPPNPNAGNALQQGAPQQPALAPAAPNHSQTVAALRHIDSIKDELQILLKNPSLGKSDVKSQIIDGVSSLVAKRIMTPAQAVIQLSSVPDSPLDQRKFLQQQLAQVTQAERGIIMHHAIGYAGVGPEPTPSADSHLDDMAALQAQYSQK